MHVFSAQQHTTMQVQEGLADLGCAQPCSAQGVLKGHSVLHVFSCIFLSVSDSFLMPLSLLLHWHAYLGNENELNGDDLLFKGPIESGYWDWNIFRVYWSCPQ